MKPLLAPRAAGCMAESGSRLPQSKDFVGKISNKYVLIFVRVPKPNP
jgi:hypothetical protein